MTDYHISPAGNDGNDGSIGSPWETINHMRQFTFAPGDSVLFERGGEYRGQAVFQLCSAPTTELLPLTMGAYGSGADPIINGWFLGEGWALSGGTVYTIAVNATVYRCCADDVVLTKGASTSPGVGEWFYETNTLYVNTGQDPASQKIEYSMLWPSSDQGSVIVTEWANIDHQVIENLQAETVWVSAVGGRGMDIGGKHTGKVIIDNCHIFTSKVLEYNNAITLTRGNVEIKNCILEDWNDAIALNNGVNPDPALQNVHIHHNIIRNGVHIPALEGTSDAIKAEQVAGSSMDMTGSIIEHNDISGFFQDGIDLFGITENLTIRYNWIHSPGTLAAPGAVNGCKNGSVNIQIHDNFFEDIILAPGNSSYGVGVAIVNDDYSGGNIYDNVFVNVGEAVVKHTATANTGLFEDNHVVGAVWGVSVSTGIQINNNYINADAVVGDPTYDLVSQSGGNIWGDGNRLENNTTVETGVINLTNTTYLRTESNVLVGTL